MAKYAIACKEARETHYWLRLLAASEIVAMDRLAELTSEANELIAILTTIVKKCKSRVEHTLHSSPFGSSLFPYFVLEQSR